jgi:phosphohistidine phosphatase SixA
MKNRTRWIFILILICFGLAESSHSQDLTTVILVRHAEKVDDSRDPELSQAGLDRAEKLADMLEQQSINSIYSTDYIRTRGTCGPIASRLGIEIKLYDSRSIDDFNAMVGSNEGGTILVCGHSNSTPRLANHFLMLQQFEDFDESDYANMLIVTIPRQGTPRVIHLRY